jgi:hypothetical protein
LNVLWTAAWMLRKRCADRADLNRCILRSRRRDWAQRGSASCCGGRGTPMRRRF